MNDKGCNCVGVRGSSSQDDNADDDGDRFSFQEAKRKTFLILTLLTVLRKAVEFQEDSAFN